MKQRNTKLKSNLKVFQVHETEAPPLLAEALTDDFFDQIRIEKIPVLIQPCTEFSGFCHDKRWTIASQIVINSHYLKAWMSFSKEIQINKLRSVYIHECAHRITNQAHYGGFLCVNILLHIRAKLLNSVTVYDFHEEKHFEDVFKWAFLLAKEMAGSELPAADCSKVIMEKYNEWRCQMELASELEAARIAEIEERKATAIVKRNKLDRDFVNRIKVLKQDRWLWAFYSSVATILTLNYFN
jgi:hypothetical protein